LTSEATFCIVLASKAIKAVPTISNFPMDKVSTSYELLWAAFDDIVEMAYLSADDERGLYGSNAAEFYRIDLALAQADKLGNL